MQYKSSLDGVERCAPGDQAERAWPAEEEAEAEEACDDERAVLVATARTLAVRYAVLMPKFKAVAFLQPEDHVKKTRINHDLHRSSRSGQLFISVTHNVSIFAAGLQLGGKAAGHHPRRKQPQPQPATKCCSRPQAQARFARTVYAHDGRVYMWIAFATPRSSALLGSGGRAAAPRAKEPW